MKNYKGITLISLVITIIILLILDGISISMIIGQNGLFNKSKEASAKYEKASAIDIGKNKISEF